MQYIPQNMNNIQQQQQPMQAMRPMQPEKKLGKKELEELEKKNKIRKKMDNYRKMPKNKGQYIIPPVIHYTKLLVDEDTKQTEKKGILYIQYDEYNLVNIENIQNKYNIDKNIFIDTGQYEWPALDKEGNNESKQEFKKKEEEKKKKKKKKKKIFKNMTFSTILDSLKKYEKIIPESHHYVVALTNISVTEYIELKDMVTPYIHDDIDKFLGNISGIIYDDLKKVNVNSDKIPGISEKISILGKSLKKLISKEIGGSANQPGTVLLPDNTSLFIVLYSLVITKSFWMLFPEKNHGFITYIIERMMEFIDNEFSNDIYHVFDKKEDIKKLVKKNTKNKSELNKSTEEKEENKPKNKEIITEILGEYFNYETEKPDESHVSINLRANSLNPEKTDLFDTLDDEEKVLKIKPNQLYIKNNSFSNKLDKVAESKINEVFTFFNSEKIDIVAILLLSTASKGLMQYLLVSGLYFIYANKPERDIAPAAVKQRIELRTNMSSRNKKNFYKTHHIFNYRNFHSFLKNENIYPGEVFIQKVGAILKKNINEQVSSYYVGNGSVYTKFLQYIWEEFKTVRSFSKIFK